MLTLCTELNPSVPAYYNNRAAAHLMRGRYQSALDDCKSVLRLDPSNARAIARSAKCYLSLGDVAEARRQYKAAIDADPANAAAKKEVRLLCGASTPGGEGMPSKPNDAPAASLCLFSLLLSLLMLRFTDARARSDVDDRRPGHDDAVRRAVRRGRRPLARPVQRQQRHAADATTTVTTVV